MAEVLITLGVIGVVAAMTIPTLMQSYQKQMYYNQFLKAVNTVENYAKTACLIDGFEDMKACDLSKYFYFEKSEPVSAVPDVVFKAAKGAKIINYDDILNDDNIPVMKSLSGEKYADDNYPVDSHPLMFSDGITIYFSDFNGGDYTVDTNGPFKGPNTIGRDLFQFHTLNWSTGDETNAITWAGMNNDGWKDNDDDCNKDDLGLMCASKLLKERKMNY